jgi:chromosome partitioning protein
MLIAVANLKSGCGQSTCAVNLACELAGEKASAGAGRWEHADTVILLSVLMLADSSDHYCSSGKLPISCEHLALVDRSGDRWTKRVLEYAAGVDYVVVDSPPHLHDATADMVRISDLVVVPCSTSDLEATRTMIGLIRRARSLRADGGPKCLLAPTRVGPGAAARKELVTELEKLGEPVGPTVHERAAFAEAFLAGRWIGDFDPNGIAHADIKAVAAAVRHLG